MVAYTCSKIIVVTANVIFMIFGLASLSVGLVFKFGWDKVKDAFEDEATKIDFDLEKVGNAVAMGGIVFGAFILIVSLMGCLGACCRWRPVLGLYATIVIILVIGQVAVVGYAASKGKDAESDLQRGLRDSLKGYNETSYDGKSKAWSAIFNICECCAVDNFTTDFTTNPFIKDTVDRSTAGIATSSLIPITCCHGVGYEDKLTAATFTKHKECLENPTAKNAYVEGCYSKVKDWLKHVRNILIGVGCAILVIEIILAAMSIYMACKKDYDD